MQSPLKLGFFIQPVHPPSRPYADVLREDREAVVLADRLGYREAFIGEHLVDSAEAITSSLAFIASLADACPSITFGTAVLPLANYHPAMAAAQVAMVDHLVQGRLVLGVGPGVPGDAEAIGDLGTDRNLKTQEAVEHMRRIWSEDPPYRIEGKFYRTTTVRSFDPQIGVGVAVRPLQKPHPPIAITTIRPDARGPHAAGARGWTGISATYIGAYVLRAQIQSYLQGRRAGRHARLSRPARFRALNQAVRRASRDCRNPAERRGSDTRVAQRGRRIRHPALHGARLDRSRARPAFHGAHGQRGSAPDRSHRTARQRRTN
jgi:alkanesulfonate monooxygenase SsuD/methylene tetrahydromethanopterin reductase-like flavin-dependent oxidoreductase (luciferase family)